jgi:hypothetical protein
VFSDARGTLPARAAEGPAGKVLKAGLRDGWHGPRSSAQPQRGRATASTGKWSPMRIAITYPMTTGSSFRRSVCTSSSSLLARYRKAQPTSYYLTCRPSIGS